MESKMEVLLSEEEMRKNVLFGTLSSGIRNKRKRSRWETVCEAVNAVGSEKCKQAEMKKKWSDIRVDVKRRMAAHGRIVTKTTGGQEKRGPTCLNRESAQLWVTLLSQGWCKHMWVTLITPKEFLLPMYLYNTQQTCSYSNQVSKFYLYSTFHR